MPHCLIEYSHEKDGTYVQKWMSTATTVLTDSGLFNAEDIKVRATQYHKFLTATPDLAFMHVVVKILSGRTEMQKKSLSDALFERLSSQIAEKTAFSVEIVDIDKEFYRKGRLNAPN